MENFDICLEPDCYDLAPCYSQIAINKQIFDNFVQDAVIAIKFIDEPGMPVVKFKMVREDKYHIYGVYFG